MSNNILLLPGDGVGPEIMAEVCKVIDHLNAVFNVSLNYASGDIGGCSIDKHGVPLTEQTIAEAKASDAVLLGAVGGPKWDNVDRQIRPETGLLKIRSELQLFANLRPAILYPQLVDASTLKPDLVADLDLMIIRELTGGIYFGEPRGVRTLETGEREGFNTYVYSESEIARIGRIAFEMARKRGSRLCSVDKANVLECSGLWREIIGGLAKDYPDVELSHMYVDSAAMELVRQPKQFDVIVTGNMFGDILSDIAAMLTGSIGMLPSASLDKNGKGLYEPVHGSAPDIAGKGIANPLAAILSLAMMLRYSLSMPMIADALEQAVGQALDKGLRTRDIHAEGMTVVSTSQMGDAIIDALDK